MDSNRPTGPTKDSNPNDGAGLAIYISAIQITGSTRGLKLPTSNLLFVAIPVSDYKWDLL
jgi:hypothetical protein